MASISTVQTKKGVKYKVSYECDRDSNNGERKRKAKTFPVGTPLKEVERFMTEVEYKHNVGVSLYAPGEKMLLGDFCKEYFEVLTPHLGVATKRGYSSICYRENTGFLSYVKPSTKLSKVTTVQLQNYLNDLNAKGLKKKTIINTRGFVSKLFGMAVRMGYINTNPAGSLIIPYNAKPKEEEKIMTIEVAKLALDYSAELGGNYEIVEWLGLLAGLRKGEMAGLRYENVFIDKGMSEIHVEEARLPMPKGVVSKSPKSTAGRRVIQIPAILADMLRRKRREYEKNRLKAGSSFVDSGYVLSNAQGAPLYPDTIYRTHQRFMRMLQEKYPKMKIDYVKLHGLRHCYASAALETGMSAKSLMSQLGHASLEMVNLYSHSYEKSKKEGVERINDLFAKHA